ncbi:MAG: B12-binding domain-containing radical SAM protein [Chloroflexi bacterium]|nr:B12-binding domain-containing radical SAM protein [Chloroflexota bacterium]
MKVVFIFPLAKAYTKSTPLKLPTSENLGISYISSLLKTNGHSVQLVILTLNNQKDVLAALAEIDPQLICFTSVSSEYYLIRNLAGRYKAMHPQVWLVAGGCHVSLNPEETIADSFDAICIGEGEYPVLELVTQLEKGLYPSGIYNMWIKNDSGIEKNPLRDFVEDLDVLPFPDRQMWKKWVRYPDKRPSVLVSRGCPFQCTYCCNHKLAKLGEGKYHRFRSPKNVLGEVMALVAECPDIEEIYFEAETIGTDMDFALQFCSELERLNHRREKPLAFGINLKVTPKLESEKLFEALHRANFRFVNIGLESGSNRIRKEVLKRFYSNEDIVKAVALAKLYDLTVHMFVMVGLPGETREDFQETIEVSRKCQADMYMLSIFYPYPGTELARTCDENGLVEGSIDIEKVCERRQPVLHQPGFSKTQVRWSYIWFDYNVYKGHKPVQQLLLRVIIRMVLVQPQLDRVFDRLLNIPLFMKLKTKLVYLD